jgi:hypothetical protein
LLIVVSGLCRSLGAAGRAPATAATPAAAAPTAEATAAEIAGRAGRAQAGSAAAAEFARLRAASGVEGGGIAHAAVARGAAAVAGTGVALADTAVAAAQAAVAVADTAVALGTAGVAVAAAVATISVALARIAAAFAQAGGRHLAALDGAAAGVGPPAELFARGGVGRAPRAAILLRHAAVAVGHGAAVGAVVRPAAAGGTAAVEGVVAAGVHIDVAMPPVAIAPQGRAHCGAGGEGEQGRARGIGVAGRIVGVGRIGRIGPGPVHDRRVIGRHVDHFRVGGHDLDDGLRFHSLGDDFLLLGILQRALGRRLAAQGLGRRQHVLLLRQEGIAQLLGPVDLLAHHRQHLRKDRERLHAGIPGLPLQRILEALAFQIRMALDPALGGDHFQRISRGHEDLGEQGVGVEGDRCDQLLDLLLGEGLGACRGGWGCRRRGCLCRR